MSLKNIESFYSGAGPPTVSQNPMGNIVQTNPTKSQPHAYTGLLPADYFINLRIIWN